MQHQIAGLSRTPDLACLLTGALFMCQLLTCGAQVLPDSSTSIPIAPAPELSGPTIAATAAQAPDSGGALLLQPLLTTCDGKIVDQNGTEVILNGLGWYGFNAGLAAPGNLSRGYDSLSQDFATIVWRLKQLGFNAIRLPFSFKHFQDYPTEYQKNCNVVEDYEARMSMVPKEWPAGLALNGYSIPMDDPPQVPGDICNFAMPDQSTRDRYLWVVDYLISQGLYVSVDFHSIGFHRTLVTGETPFSGADDYSLYDVPGWTQLWVQLLQDILKKTPQARGRLLIDLINEPDGYDLTWDGSNGYPAITDVYLYALPRIWAVCKDCVFLIEGTGQSGLGATWGNGFATDPDFLKEDPSSSSAKRFLETILDRPYLPQIVLAPHLYCPAVSGAKSGFKPSLGQYRLYYHFFGYLTAAPGFCKPSSADSKQRQCHVFAVVNDEFGSTFGSQDERDCFQGIVDWMNNAPISANYTHSTMKSWFYWAYNPDSGGTGGIVDKDNWRDIDWMPIHALTGGSADFKTGLGLKPWYVKGHTDPQGPGLLPGKLLDIPKAEPVFWTPQAKITTIALGMAVGAAFLWLAICTCWFTGLFERVPVKQDNPPKFDEPKKDTTLPAVQSREGSKSEDRGLSVIL